MDKNVKNGTSLTTEEQTPRMEVFSKEQPAVPEIEIVSVVLDIEDEEHYREIGELYTKGFIHMRPIGAGVGLLSKEVLPILTNEERSEIVKLRRFKLTTGQSEKISLRNGKCIVLYADIIVD